MEDLDLDSFIANIESTAPEDSRGASLECNECGGHLEEDDDGNYTCPLCSVQATNILQLDDTELHHDEQGRPVYGQRVRLVEKKSKHAVDYGWSWSTDDAIFHILVLQVKALKEARLVTKDFIENIMLMWKFYWLDFIAPHIQDDYSEANLIPISARKALKLRDVEVLMKVKDKVMIPLQLLKGRKDAKIIYRMLSTKFSKTAGSYDGLDDESSESYDSDNTEYLGTPENSDNPDETTAREAQTSREVPEAHETNEPPQDEPMVEDELSGDNGQISLEDLEKLASLFKGQTRNISVDSVSVLTLNRTLAFLEATARCLSRKDPLFAADIIRACNQRLIPFYNASRVMPENVKFDQRDKLAFQKTRPPTPNQLSRTALLLLSTVNAENGNLPITLPVPDLTTILERFTRDLNLPRAVFESIKGKATFYDFAGTRPRTITKPESGYLPQYDRWAFAVLIVHLKMLFNLSDDQIAAQEEKALRISRDGRGDDYFIFHDWCKQLSLRLELILRYDPYVLYHPLTEIERMELTPQLSKYLEQIIEDRVSADVTLHGNDPYYDDEARRELADLLLRELPFPEEMKREFSDREELHVSREIKYPLLDAFNRTQQSWASKLDVPARDLAFRSFSTKELVLLEDLPHWSIYDCGLALKAREPEISPQWPKALILLLHVGAFLCFCEPEDLLNELKSIEQEYHPQVKGIKRMNYARKRRLQREEAGCSAPSIPRI